MFLVEPDYVLGGALETAQNGGEPDPSDPPICKTVRGKRKGSKDERSITGETHESKKRAREENTSRNKPDDDTDKKKRADSSKRADGTVWENMDKFESNRRGTGADVIVSV